MATTTEYRVHLKTRDGSPLEPWPTHHGPYYDMMERVKAVLLPFGPMPTDPAWDTRGMHKNWVSNGGFFCNATIVPPGPIGISLEAFAGQVAEAVQNAVWESIGEYVALDIIVQRVETVSLPTRSSMY